MKRKILSLLMIAALSCALLAGCNPAQQIPDLQASNQADKETLSDTSAQNSSSQTDDGEEASRPSDTENATDENTHSTDEGSSASGTATSGKPSGGNPPSSSSKPSSSKPSSGKPSSGKPSNTSGGTTSNTGSSEDTGNGSTSGNQTPPYPDPVLNVDEQIASYVAFAKWTSSNSIHAVGYGVDGETVWVAAAPNGHTHLYAFDTTRLTVAHAVDLGVEPESLQISGDTVWVLLSNGWLKGFNKKTAILTAAHYLSEDAVSPIVSKNKIFYSTSKKGLLCYDIATHKTTTLIGERNTYVCVADESTGTVYCIKKGLLVAFDPNTLQEKGRLTGINGSSGKAFISNGSLYFSSQCVSLSDLSLKDRSYAGTEQVLHLNGNYMTTVKGVYNVKTGKKLCSLSFSSRIGYTAILTDHGKILLWDEEMVTLKSAEPANFQGLKTMTLSQNDSTAAPLAKNPFLNYQNRATYELGTISVNHWSQPGTSGLFGAGIEYNAGVATHSLCKLTVSGKIEKKIVFSSIVGGFRVVGNEVQISLPEENRIQVYRGSDLSLIREITLPVSPYEFAIAGNMVFCTVLENQYSSSCTLIRYNISTGQTDTIPGDFEKSSLYADESSRYLYVAETATTAAQIYCFDKTTLQIVSQFEEFGISLGIPTEILFYDGKIYAGRFCLEAGTLRPLWEYDSTISHVSDKYVLTKNSVYNRQTNEMYSSLPQGGVITYSYGGGILLSDETMIQFRGQNLVVWKKQ